MSTASPREPVMRAAALAPVAVIGSDWSATLATVASLGARGVPVRVYGTGAARWSRHAQHAGDCPSPDDIARFAPWLRERVRSGEIVRLAPTSDLIAWYLAELRTLFDPDVQCAIAPLGDIEDALFKTRFARRAANAGLAVPATCAPTDIDAAVEAGRRLGYPLLLKPRAHIVVGTLVRGQLVPDEATLRRVFCRLPVQPGHEPLAERYIELGWPMLQRYVATARQGVVSVAGFRDPVAGVVNAGVSCKLAQWPADVGTSVVQRSWHAPDALALAKAAVPSMLSAGIFELELLRDGTGWVAIDLNPRAFGFLALELARGNDLPWLWYLATLPAAQRAAVEAASPARVVSQAPLEARDVLPYTVARLRGRLPAPACADVPAQWVPMIPVGGDGMAGLIGNLKALRHPRALLRVFAPRGPAQQPCAPAPASPLAPLMTAAPVPASPQATAHVPAPAAGEKPGAAPAAAGGTTKMENVR